jgi:hypothetical protein
VLLQSAAAFVVFPWFSFYLFSSSFALPSPLTRRMLPSVLVMDSRVDGAPGVELAARGTRLHLALVAPAQPVQLQQAPISPIIITSLHFPQMSNFSDTIMLPSGIKTFRGNIRLL